MSYNFLPLRYVRYAGSARNATAAAAAYGTYKAKQYLYGNKAPTKAMAKRVKRTVRRRVRRNVVPTVCVDAKARKAIQKVRRLAESDMGTHTHRIRSTARLLSSVNSCNTRSDSLVSITNLEAALAQLRYYNPSDPGTLVQASGLTGTFQKEFNFTKVYARSVVRNNYQVPVKVSIYMCTPKDDTSITPLESYTNGLTDVGNPSASSALVFLTDSPQFSDLWRVVSSKSVELKPGRKVSVKFTGKPFQYDPSLIDNHAMEYQSKYDCCATFLRIEGIIGHDTAADEQGTIQAGVDVVNDIRFEIQYSAGADIRYITVSNGSDTFTNGGVVSSYPVADNIGYSVS